MGHESWIIPSLISEWEGLLQGGWLLTGVKLKGFFTWSIMNSDQLEDDVGVVLKLIHLLKHTYIFPWLHLGTFGEFSQMSVGILSPLSKYIQPTKKSPWNKNIGKPTDLGGPYFGSYSQWFNLCGRLGQALATSFLTSPSTLHPGR